MRRALRLLLNVATMLSALLCVATVVFWVRSYTRHDAVFIVRAHHGFEIESGPAHLCLSYYAGWFEHPAVEYVTYPVAGDSDEIYIPLGRVGDFDPRRRGRDVSAVLPYWLILALFGAAPTRRYVRARRHRKRLESMGHCPTCGYDCRATPDRCPECGREAAAAKDAPW